MSPRDPTLLYVLRHAHSAPSLPGQGDYERPLDDRGREEAAEIGREMQKFGAWPVRVLCSGATRTRETLSALGLEDIAAEFSDELYSGGIDRYLALAGSLGETKSVLIVGHNPMIAEFVSMLAGKGEETAMRQLASGVPTGTLAVIELANAWGRIEAGAGFLKRLVVPGDRKAAR